VKREAIRLIFTVALMALFVAGASDSLARHDAGGALLTGIAIGILAADLVFSIFEIGRRRSLDRRGS